MGPKDSYTSGAAFVEFWDYVAREGKMNVNSARALGSAVRQVLSVEEDWEKVDISTMDVNDLLTQFAEERGDAYSQRTLDAYRLRFRRALRRYLDYLADPEGWGSAKKTQSGALDEKAPRGYAPQERRYFPRTSVTQIGVRMISYPFPLRDDCVIQLRLPVELSSSDVERLTAYLKTLVITPGDEENETKS